MSLRLIGMLLVVACGAPPVDPHEPRTAREKQLQEAQASGEIDKPNSKWGGWRYQGDRKDCFFVLGRRCFKTEKDACVAARCKAPAVCDSIGAGPATITCKKS
ncbi:MAG TPA: hypothetical protein VLX92_04650 [Kofleriaceae bacterium]|nr:hypothetical protein [Kofleriaceae bacterium]